jgi:hypothetical protein
MGASLAQKLADGAADQSAPAFAGQSDPPVWNDQPSPEFPVHEADKAMATPFDIAACMKVVMIQAGYDGEPPTLDLS